MIYMLSIQYRTLFFIIFWCVFFLRFGWKQLKSNTTLKLIYIFEKNNTHTHNKEKWRNFPVKIENIWLRKRIRTIFRFRFFVRLFVCVRVFSSSQFIDFWTHSVLFFVVKLFWCLPPPLRNTNKKKNKSIYETFYDGYK